MQIEPYTPYTLSITASIKQGENVIEAEKKLHKIVIEQLYSDVPLEANNLIKRFNLDETKADLPNF